MAMYSSVVNINNSILWSNNGPIIYSPETSGVTYLEASYSDIEGGQDLFSQFSNIIFTTEGGIINQDPGFCFSYDSTYSLQETSICQEASDTAGVIGAYQATCQQLGLDNGNELKNLSLIHI